jgi:hypothetical protein
MKALYWWMLYSLMSQNKGYLAFETITTSDFEVRTNQLFTNIEIVNK